MTLNNALNSECGPHELPGCPPGVFGVLFRLAAWRPVPSPARRSLEFEAGRRCARQAVRAAGAVDPRIGRRADGAPLWPAGFAGSIAHQDGRVLAVAARVETHAALGVDWMPSGRVPARFDRALFRDGDQWAWRPDGQTPVGERGDDPACLREAWRERIWTAREALFKLRSPPSDPPGFLRQALRIDGAYRFRSLRDPGGPGEAEGCWWPVAGGWLALAWVRGCASASGSVPAGGGRFS